MRLEKCLQLCLGLSGLGQSLTAIRRARERGTVVHRDPPMHGFGRGGSVAMPPTEGHVDDHLVAVEGESQFGQ